ncbi:MAG: recombinase family protein [Candidatus Shapirobacteria bacterium]
MNNTNQQKAVLFCRVSSKEQEETGYSLPSQQKLLTEYCQSKGLVIDKIFSLSESAGGHKQRKMFFEMLDYLKKTKIKNLVVEKTDRLTRNMRDAVIMDEWISGDNGRQIHFVKENFILCQESRSNDKFMWSIKVTTAQYYLDNLSEEVKKGQKEKIRQGWLPTTPPYGYKTVGDKGHKIHVIDEEMAPLIRKMFELYATGDYSLQRLTEEMRKLGLKSSKGGKIHKSRIHALLTDPFYIGKFKWNGVEYQGQQIPLIEVEVFEKVNRILTAKTTPYYTKHDYLFKGMFRCSECRGLITWEEHKGFIYGHCNHRNGCSVRDWVKEGPIEDKLVEELASFKVENERLMKWLGKALKETNQTESNIYLKSVEELEKDRKIYKNRLDAIYIDKIDGKIGEDFYNQKFKEFSEDLEKIDTKITKQTKLVNSGQQDRVTLYELAQEGREKYLRGKENDRRELMRMVFKKLELKGEKITFKLKKSFRELKFLIKNTNSSKMGEIIDSGNKIFEQYDLMKTSKYFASSQPECSVLLPL